MALSIATREWFSKHDVEGFLRVTNAPPHDKAEKVAPAIDMSEITEGVVQALTGLQVGGLQLVECPSNEILLEYFEVYSLSSKAYRT